MAYKRISAIAFLADYISDLETLPKSPMGAECHVIENAAEYKCNSLGEWVFQYSANKGSNSSGDVNSNPNNYYTKAEVDNQINDKVHVAVYNALSELSLTHEELINILNK